MDSERCYNVAVFPSGPGSPQNNRKIGECLGAVIRVESLSHACYEENNFYSFVVNFILSLETKSRERFWFGFSWLMPLWT